MQGIAMICHTHHPIWGFLTHVYYLVLIWYFPSNLQPEAIINILQKRKKSQRQWRPNIWLGVYHAMKQNPPKEKLVLKEYLGVLSPA
jgi:hypothetical protein